MKDEGLAVLEIKSIQDGEESLLFISNARVINHKKFKLIEFDGTEICGIPGEITSFKIGDDNNIEMKTTGKNRVSSAMIFESGKKQHCHYFDMYDEPVVIGFSTSSVKSKIDENGGDVEIDYFVEYNNELSSKNSMKLVYKYKDIK